jgi:hypothetical protein
MADNRVANFALGGGRIDKMTWRKTRVGGNSSKSKNVFVIDLEEFESFYT